MGYTEYIASPSSCTIQYSDSSARSSTVTWSKPGSQYTMTGLQLAFTTNNSGYYVYVYHKIDGQAIIVGEYSSGVGSGEHLITIPERMWADVAGDTYYMNFRHAPSSSTAYSNIRLIVTYESNASPSTARALDAIAGQAQTVNITNENSTVYHQVTWKYGSLSGATFTQIVTSGVLTFGAATRSPGWAVPSANLASLYNANPDRPTIPGKIVVETFTSEGVSVGSVTVDAELSMPTDPLGGVGPFGFSVYTFQPNAAGSANPAVMQLYYGEGTLLSGLCEVQVQADMPEGQYNATIVSAKVQTPDGTYDVDTSVSEYVAFTLNTSGNIVVRGIVTDSRGLSCTEEEPYTITPYHTPSIMSMTAVRCNSGGTENDDGAYIKIQAAVSYSDNIASLSSFIYRITESGSSTVLLTGNLVSGTSQVVGGSLSAEKSYTVTVIATDDIGYSGSAALGVGSGLFTIHRLAGGKGLAFGQAADRYGVSMNPNWPLYTHGQEIQELLLDFAHPVGSVLETLDADFDPNAVWPWSVWNRLQDVFLLAAGQRAVLDSGGAESATASISVTVPQQSITLTADQLPRSTLVGVSNQDAPVYSGARQTQTRSHGSVTGYSYISFIGNDQSDITISGATVSGTDTVSTMPPYLTVNMWVRAK